MRETGKMGKERWKNQNNISLSGTPRYAKRTPDSVRSVCNATITSTQRQKAEAFATGFCPNWLRADLGVIIPPNLGVVLA
jgi:hypothetical protein